MQRGCKVDFQQPRIIFIIKENVKSEQLKTIRTDSEEKETLTDTLCISLWLSKWILVLQ